LTIGGDVRLDCVTFSTATSHKNTIKEGGDAYCKVKLTRLLGYPIQEFRR